MVIIGVTGRTTMTDIRVNTANKSFMCSPKLVCGAGFEPATFPPQTERLTGLGYPQTKLLMRGERVNDDDVACRR